MKAPVLTVRKIESRYFARTAKTKPMWIALLGNLEVAYMRTKKGATKAGLSQMDYVMSDMVGAEFFRKRNASLLWPV